MTTSPIDKLVLVTETIQANQRCDAPDRSEVKDSRKLRARWLSHALANPSCRYDCTTSDFPVGTGKSCRENRASN